MLDTTRKLLIAVSFIILTTLINTLCSTLIGQMLFIYLISVGIERNLSLVISLVGAVSLYFSIQQLIGVMNDKFDSNSSR